MGENKITFWGDLDIASRGIEEIAGKFSKLWVSGEYRMRDGDIERLAKYLKLIRDSEKDMFRVLKLFEVMNEPFRKEEAKV